MRRCASKLRSNDGIQALEHLLGALWMLLTLAEGQQAKAVLGVGGKGVRLVVQLIQQAFTPAVGGTEIATSSSTTGAVLTIGPQQICLKTFFASHAAICHSRANVQQVASLESTSYASKASTQKP